MTAPDISREIPQPVSAERPAFLVALTSIAARAADRRALVGKQRGVWGAWRWRDVVAEIDRLAAGLSRLGVVAGSTVAVDGEITPRLLLAAAAVRALDARILGVPTRASGTARNGVLDDPSVTAVIAQGRDVVAEWAEIVARGRRVPIVFDHATAGGRSPSAEVITLEALRTSATPAGWADGLPQGSAGDAATVWIEESTDWREGLDLILEHWVTRGTPLVLPELLAAGDRDRAEAGPAAWIASAARLDATAAAIRDRLPSVQTATGRLVAAALADPSAIWARLVVARLRRRLGLAALTHITVHGADRLSPSAQTRHLFAALGAEPVTAGAQTGGSRGVPAAANGEAIAGAGATP